MNRLKLTPALRSLASASRDGVVLFDDQGGIVFGNERARVLWGVSAEVAWPGAADLLKRLKPCPADLKHPDSLADPAHVVRRVLAGETIEDETVRIGDEDLSIRILPIGTDGTEAGGGLVMLRDSGKDAAAAISLKIIEIEKQVEDAKALFLANMSHEFRAPLTQIGGFLALLRDQVSEATRNELIEPLSRAHQNLLSFVNTLLDLARLEDGSLELRVKPFVLRTVLIAACDTADCAARDNGLAFTWRLDPAVPARFMGDQFRIKRIIDLLLSNAVHFTEAGSVALEVSGSTLPDARFLLEARVTDTGIGIAAAEMEKIFDRYYQVDSTLTRRRAGAGLGLALCRKLAELMNGTIEVESRPGAGSVFTLRVPLPIVSAGHDAGAEALLKGPWRVLVVDDDDTISRLVAYLLARAGHKVETAANGQEGFEVFQRAEFDLVIMDIQMPVMDGYAATRQIRKWEIAEGKSPCIITALTAHGFKSHFEMSIAAGCDAHLSKPIDPSRFLQILENVIREALERRSE